MTIQSRAGQALKRVRLNAGKEQGQIADALGVSQAAVSRYESGGCNINIVQLFLIAHECGVTFAALATEIQKDVLK